ncbi:MAG: hypothetical protein LBU66_01575, partial [Treponema sp.]|nr:hypothetical protein [Treponema sp.]
MAKKKIENTKHRKIANASSIMIMLFMTASFAFETFMKNIQVNYGVAGLIALATFLILISIIRNTINHYKLAFNVPIVILVFYTFLMLLSGWNVSHYFIMCIALAAISCIYSSFNRTTTFIVAQNIVIGFLVIRGFPVGGPGMSFSVILINWAVFLFSSIIMLAVKRAATVVLNRAVEHQNSFRNLLETTENYVAMVDDRNEIVYASKTLSQLGNVEDPTLVQGRPIIDIFPGRTLKIYAGNLLKEKENYAQDWEFTLYGQKRYFKAISHPLAGGTGGSLISLYDMTHLAERDEIAAMKDSMKIGLF